MDIGRNLYQNKDSILYHLRCRAKESYGEIIRIHGERDYKKRAKLINKAIANTTQNLKNIVIQRALSEFWNREEILNNILMLAYCSYVVMIEYRNKAWPYEYMAFSRRIGEFWEPFCKICFDFPVRKDVKLFEPPLFSDVKMELQKEIYKYIENLNLTDSEKRQLADYYDKVWSLVTSGEIKLELDLHFQIADQKYHVDFKSGFQSNEKGNTNRLLLVASVYRNIIDSDNKCMLFVRASEDKNNHYLQTLKNSGVWDVYCGKETYRQIKTYSGFDLASWIESHIQWQNDLEEKTLTYFRENDLEKYLSW